MQGRLQCILWYDSSCGWSGLGYNGMKILLCNCDFAPASLALLNLKSYALADAGLKDKIEIRILGSTPHEDPEATIGAILTAAQEFKPDIVGMSLYIWSRFRMYEAAKRLRFVLPAEARIIWGGPDVSDLDYARVLLDDNPAVNVIARDEGERTFALLLHHYLGTGKPLDQISGITWRDAAGELHNTDKVAYLDNLDDIPSILDLPEVANVIDKIDVFALETFRGCYMGCAYCYWGGTTRRSFSMPRVFSDLGRVLAHKNIKRIWFFDSMFGFKKQTAKDLLRFIVENKAPDQSVTFFPNLDFLDEELCRLMKEAGVYIETGIQTTNDEAYESLNRKWDKKFLDSKIPLLRKYGLHSNNQQLILGLPGDGIDGFRGSVDYAFQTHPDSIVVFPFSVLPATGYWQRRAEFKMEYEGEFRIVYNSTTFPQDAMIRGGLIAVGVKWFEHAPGLAIKVVELLGIRPADLFEKMGEDFMSDVWHLKDTPQTRPEVRKALLCQAFKPEDTRHLNVALLRKTLNRHFAHLGHQQELDALFEHQQYLNSDVTLDARVLPAEAVEAARAEWTNAAHAVGPLQATVDIFGAAPGTMPDSDPITFLAWEVVAPKDFFGKDLPRWKVLVLAPDDVRCRQPA